MEFQTWWVLKSSSNMKFLYFVNWHSVGPTKIGPMFRKCNVWKLELEKKTFYKTWSPKLIFLNDFFFNSVIFCHRKMTLIVSTIFGTFLGPGVMSICKRMTTVDFWPKTLLFRTQRVRNSMTRSIHDPTDIDNFNSLKSISRILICTVKKDY